MKHRKQVEFKSLSLKNGCPVTGKFWLIFLEIKQNYSQIHDDCKSAKYL